MCSQSFDNRNDAGGQPFGGFRLVFCNMSANLAKSLLS
jgi:hypothetical protein